MLVNDGLYWVRSGWVSQLMGWVGLGDKKWTHGQLWLELLSRILSAGSSEQHRLFYINLYSPKKTVAHKKTQ